MISQTTNHKPFSATVQLSLEIDDETFSVSAVAPDRFVLTKAQVLRSGQAVLKVNIDGQIQQTPITISPPAEPSREFQYTRN